ncbi:hypothetical protein D3C81_1379440 [compost metagenome]
MDSDRSRGSRLMLVNCFTAGCCVDRGLEKGLWSICRSNYESGRFVCTPFNVNRGSYYGAAEYDFWCSGGLGDY